MWPHGGNNLLDLIVKTKGYINSYPDIVEIIVFDKQYKDISVKDDERMWRAEEEAIDYELSITSPLPKRDVVLKNKNSNRPGWQVCCLLSAWRKL